jgi:mannose-6-phosphate isomerase-like protein (cupin superfamily)
MDSGGPLVVRPEDRRDVGRTDGGTYSLVQQEDLGLGELTVGISENPPDMKPFRHRHSCGEVFVVYEGRGIYTIGDTEVMAGPGDMVVIPPNTWHSFRPAGNCWLRHVTVYDSGKVDIELPSGRVIGAF